jgi:hypothetical protein
MLQKDSVPNAEVMRKFGLNRPETKRLRLVLRYSRQSCGRLYKKSKNDNGLYSRSQTGLGGIHQPAIMRAESVISTMVTILSVYVPRIFCIPEISVYREILIYFTKISFNVFFFKFHFV